jgi:hypothetical protein
MRQKLSDFRILRLASHYVLMKASWGHLLPIFQVRFNHSLQVVILLSGITQSHGVAPWEMRHKRLGENGSIADIKPYFKDM